MNSIERINATVAGTPLDRRAVTPVLGLYGARLIDCPLEKYYTVPAAYARGQSAVLETFKPDVLCAPLAFSFIGAAFGSELAFLATVPPNIRRPAIQSHDEWDRIEIPDPDGHPRLLFFRDVIRLMAAEHGKDVPIAMVVPIPADIPELVMGFEGWLGAVAFEREVAQRIMDRIIPFYIQLLNGFFAAGATFIVMPCGMASPAIVTREIVMEFTRPILAHVLPRLNGPVILHNVGAPILPHLDLLAGLPSVVGFIVDQRDDLDTARCKIGNESVLFGGLDCANVGRMTAAEVEARCLAILEERRHDARFVLGTSGPDVSWDTPAENIHAMRKAAESFGRIDS